MLADILHLLSLVSISYVLFTLWLLWGLWVLYVAMLSIERTMESAEIPWQAKLLVYPTKTFFDFIELIANTFICTIIFLDLPREYTVSDRLRRYYNNPYEREWRTAIVHFVKPMLDPFDHNGPHI